MNYKFLGWCLFCIILVFSAGCARTMTIKSDAGSELDMVIRFNGPVSSASQNYYIIFPNATLTGTDISRVAPVNINYDPYPWFDAPKGSDNLPQFNEKLNQIYSLGHIGTQLVPDMINYYFFNYYSNWYDYLEIRGSTLLLHKGPFTVNGTVSTTDNAVQITYITQSDPTVLSFSLPLNFLSNPYAKGDNIYFFITTVKDFQVVDWEPKISFIKNEVNSNLQETDDAYSQNDALSNNSWFPSAKLRSWDAYIR